MSYGRPTPQQVAAVRHRFFVKPEPPYKEPPPRVLCHLNPEEQAKAARNKALVYERLPEAVPFIKELHEAGMIDGWRGVVKVELLQEGNEHGTA